MPVHAIEDYTAVLASRPAMVEALARRGAAYDWLAWRGRTDSPNEARVALGRADIAAAIAPDPPDDDLAGVLENHEGLRPGPGR